MVGIHVATAFQARINENVSPKLVDGVRFAIGYISYVQPKWLTEPKIRHCPNQGRTLNDILLRAAHCMACFDLSKLNLS